MNKKRKWLAFLMVIILIVFNPASTIAAVKSSTPPPAPTLSYSPTTLTNGNVTVTVYYPSSAVIKQYKLGSNGTWLSYTAPIVLTSNVYVYIQYRDKYGKWSALGGYNITNIDKTSPMNPGFTASTNASTNQSVSITIGYSADSAVRQYKIGSSGDWTSYNGSIILSDNDTVYARASDSVGNWTPEVSYIVANIDKTAPAAPTFVSYETNHEVSVEIIYSDDSIIKQYRLGSGEAWENYAGPIVLKSNDILYAKSSDAAGNWTEEASYENANIDNTAPINPVFAASTSEMTNQDITVSIDFSYDSYIKQYRLGIDGAWIDYVEPVVITSNGILYAIAADAAGNWTSEVSYIISNIDKTAPAAPTFTPSTTDMTNRNVEVVINYSDDSAIRQYKLGENGIWSDYTVPLVLGSNDTIYAKAADMVGNWTGETVYEVTNINTAPPENPVITASATVATTQPVTVTISYSDDSSIRQYRIGESGEWTSYTEPILLKANNTVYAKASNTIGNWTPEVKYSVTNIQSMKTVLGYTVNSSAYNVMVANSSTLSEIATATWTVDGLGNLSGSAPADQISFGNSNGIKTNLMVGNNFDKTIAKTLLESSANRTNLINNILNKLKAYNYTGVNIDIENIPAEDRAYFTTFMSEVYGKLKLLGYEVTVAVQAKTYDSPNAAWNYAFDYKSLAEYSDYLMIMAYDDHYPGGTPGAIASIGWVTNIVNYALTVVPKEKIVLGLAAYGYDWPANGGTTRAYSINGCYNLASTYKVPVMWDDTTKSKYFKYTDSTGIGHTVWFEDADTIAYKLKLVNEKDLRGIGIWRLGLENTDYWNAINTAFKY